MTLILVFYFVLGPCPRRHDLDVSKVEVYTYNFKTGSNEKYLLSEAAEKITKGEDFDDEQCIHVIVPGFENDIGSEVPREAICALSDYQCNDMNILLVIIDHSEYLSGSSLEKPNILGLYEKAVKYTKSVSYSLGKFFSAILEKIPKDRFYAAGHSLGAHIVGKAAEFSAGFNHSLSKILAIDPAAPCYKDCLEEHVKKGQADSVVAIHCNAGELGSYLNLTDYDVYAGNGVTQKGCKDCNIINVIADSQTSNCSHYRCVPIALQTALRPNLWEATKCDDYKDLCGGSCDANDKSQIGYDVDIEGPAGVYFFKPKGDLQCEYTIY